MNLSKNIFCFQDKVYKKISSSSGIVVLAKSIYKYSTIAFFAYALLFSTLKGVFNMKIFTALCIVNLISLFVSGLRLMSISLVEFLKKSLITTLIVGVIFYQIFYISFSNYTVSYILLVLFITSIWSFLCTTFNLELGKIANLIMAVIVSILLQLNSFIWSKLEFNQATSAFCITKNYQLNELIINIVLYPIFVMTAVGGLACAYKEYWIKRYGKFIEGISKK